MRNLLLLTLLLMSVSSGQNVTGSNDGSSVVVLGFKWSKTRQTIKKVDSASAAPAAMMTQANKNFERNQRVNDPAGARDPNADTIDARSAAMEKIVQESRSSGSKTVDGFEYRVKVQNASNKVIEILFWEYQFIDQSNPTTVARRQFLCGVNIKPDKEKELQAFSLSAPSDVVSVKSLGNKTENLFKENVVINRVEYADRTIWQRKDWNFAEIRLTYKRAVETPWGSEMCRGL
ncbi:MAG: hypothetical protein H0U54_07795 [Acidobacteria bacterium]|nr:hypothetical protein [Acidobacteriota bacterium]